MMPTSFQAECKFHLILMGAVDGHATAPLMKTLPLNDEVAAAR
jgi:hypothetical protein